MKQRREEYVKRGTELANRKRTEPGPTDMTVAASNRIGKRERCREPINLIMKLLVWHKGKEPCKPSKRYKRIRLSNLIGAYISVIKTASLREPIVRQGALLVLVAKNYVIVSFLLKATLVSWIICKQKKPCEKCPISDPLGKLCEGGWYIKRVNNWTKVIAVRKWVKYKRAELTLTYKANCIEKGKELKTIVKQQSIMFIMFRAQPTFGHFLYNWKLKGCSECAGTKPVIG